VGARARGILSWANTSAQTDLPVPAGFRTPTGSATTVTVANFIDDTLTSILQSMFDQTGDAEMDLSWIVGSTLRKKISRLTSYSLDQATFAQVRMFQQDAEDAKITMKVSLLDTDFGRVVVRPSSFINISGDPTSAASKRAGIIMPMVDECVRMRFAWDPVVEELPKDGGGPRALAENAFVLEVGNPLWLGTTLLT